MNFKLAIFRSIQFGYLILFYGPNLSWTSHNIVYNIVLIKKQIESNQTSGTNKHYEPSSQDMHGDSDRRHYFTIYSPVIFIWLGWFGLNIVHHGDIRPLLSSNLNIHPHHFVVINYPHIKLFYYHLAIRVAMPMRIIISIYNGK